MTPTNLNLSAEQQLAIQKGQAIDVNVAGVACVVLRKDVFEQGEMLDYSPWSNEELDLLAAEAADLLACDGLDEESA